MKQEDYQKSYKLNEALKKGAQILKETGFDSYILDSKVLMQFILNYSQEELILNHDSYITLMQAEKYFGLSSLIMGFEGVEILSIQSNKCLLLVNKTV